MRNFILLFFLMVGVAGVNVVSAQEVESLSSEKDELSAQIAELKGQLAPLQSRVDAINKELQILGGWQTGTFGTLGFNLSSFNNWIKGANPNSTSSTILAAFNGFANRKNESWFWRNSGTINLGWQKLDIDTEGGEDADYEKVADVLRITSLYGRNISPKLAVSALGEYNTALLENFNNPGILDIGAGVTWLPIENMVVVIHPLNMHWVFGDLDQFESGLGAKVVADYSKTFDGGITWRTNLTSFLPYSSTEPTLREYTWTNSIAFNAWKGIGVGIEYAIRNAPVETFGLESDNQSYFILGLSYAL